MKKDEFITRRTEIISDMLDNPDQYTIYPTTKAFKEFDKLFDELEKEVQAIKKQNKQLSVCLGQLMRSMLAHPDCTEGSEFDDFTSKANELLND